MLPSLSPYNRRFMTVLTGTGVSQAIVLGSWVLLTRFYGATEIGIFAVFSSLTMIGAVVATARLEHAILLPQNPQEAMQVLRVALSLAFLLSCLMAALGLLFTWSGVPLGGIELRPGFVIASAAGTFLLASLGCLTLYINRLEDYSALSVASVLQALVTSTAALGLGFRYPTAWMLIAATLLGQFVGISFFLHRSRLDWTSLWQGPTWADYRRVFDTQRRFPIFSLPTDLLNTLVNQLPVFVLGQRFDSQVVGYYSLTQRLFSMSTALVSGSVLSVFRQQAAASYASTGRFDRDFTQALRLLLKLVSLPVLVIGLFAPSLFGYCFGSEWRISGEFARLMLPFFVGQFVVSPLSYGFYIAQKQDDDMAFHVLLGFLTCGALLLGVRWWNTPAAVVGLFGFGYAVFYFFYFRRARQLSQLGTLASRCSIDR